MASLEERVAALEATVKREAQLRAEVDLDQADQGGKIRAMHHLVQALSITQSEHSDQLRRIENTLRRVETGNQMIIDMLQRLERPSSNGS